MFVLVNNTAKLFVIIWPSAQLHRLKISFFVYHFDFGEFVHYLCDFVVSQFYCQMKLKASINSYFPTCIKHFSSSFVLNSLVLWMRFRSFCAEMYVLHKADASILWDSILLFYFHSCEGWISNLAYTWGCGLYNRCRRTHLQPEKHFSKMCFFALHKLKECLSIHIWQKGTIGLYVIQCILCVLDVRRCLLPHFISSPFLMTSSLFMDLL